jgi:hypothetical protein
MAALTGHIPFRWVENTFRWVENAFHTDSLVQSRLLRTSMAPLETRAKCAINRLMGNMHALMAALTSLISFGCMENAVQRTILKIGQKAKRLDHSTERMWPFYKRPVDQSINQSNH